MMDTMVYSNQLIHGILQADGFAKNGFQVSRIYSISEILSFLKFYNKKKVYVPDFLEGDPLPNDAFESGTVC